MKRIISGVLCVLLILMSVPYCAIAEEDNLLYNGGFEEAVTDGAGSWKFSAEKVWTAEGEVKRVNSAFSSGEYSALVTQGTIGQRVWLEAGITYTLTAYVMAKSETASPDMGFYADDSGGYPSQNPQKKLDITADSEWSKVTLSYECTTSGSYTICLMSWEDNTEVYFDDVTLLGEKQASLIKNEDFSDGTEGWTVTGSGEALVQNEILTVSGTDYEERIAQSISGLENGIYDLCAYVSNDSIDGICYLYAKAKGSSVASTAVGEGKQQRIVVPGVSVRDGEMDIGLYIKGSSNVSIDNFSLYLSDNTRVPFLAGGEISKLTYVEDKGGVFKYADGTEGDALQIMAENGFNLARIRVLNDPGKGNGDGTFYLPEGYQTEEDCLELARRAKDKGMQILFSFAYSDYWSDGEHQIIPHEWREEIADKGLTGEAMYTYLEDKVYSYTKDIMLKLIDQGTCPEYVSIGNEIQLGIFFGYWKDRDALYNNSSALARFIKAGAKAVRETSPGSKIVLHSDHGGAILSSKKNSDGVNVSARSTFTSMLNLLDMAGKNDATTYYDVIGVSYYPYYIDTVSIDDVVNEFNQMVTKYDKDVIIMETGYNWNELRGDGWDGQLLNSGYYQDIYGETQNGQRAFLTELYSKLKQVLGGRCIGDLYWDPVMVYDGGTYTVGWAVKEDGDYTDANVVSNSTIFDFEGKAVAGQLAMKYNTNASDNIKITGTVTDKNGIAKNLPVDFSVNDKQYTVTTDKFGKYILSVPYPEAERLSISAVLSEKKYETDAPADAVFVYGIDFFLEEKEITGGGDIISELNARVENGKIIYETKYETETQGAVLYIALYDESGRLISCKKNAQNGEFEIPDERGKYRISVLLWDRTKPLTALSEAVSG